MTTISISIIAKLQCQPLDGYASFDGWQVRLRAPREGGDHVVFLEDGLTLQAFFEFLETLPIKRPN